MAAVLFSLPGTLAGAAPPLVGAVESLRGNIQVRSEAEPEWRDLQRDTVLREEDRLRTGPGSWLEIDLGGQAHLVLQDTAVVHLKTFRTGTNGVPQIGLRSSSGRLRVATASKRNPNVVIETPEARVATRSGNVVVESADGRTRVAALAGLAEVKQLFQMGETAVQLSPGKRCDVLAGKEPLPSADLELAAYRDWGVPAPPVERKDRHPDWVAPDNEDPMSQSVATSPEGRKEDSLGSFLPEGFKPRNRPRPAAKSNAPPEPEDPDPVFPKWPWKFEFKNNLQVGYFLEPTNAGSTNYGYTLQVAGISIPHVPHWATLTWLPELRFGPFGVGFYLPVIFGIRDQFYMPAKWYNLKEWDFQAGDSDLVDKLVFLDVSVWRFRLRYGGIPNLEWGSGYLLRNFGNMLEFPTKRVNGLIFTYEQKGPGISATFFSGDLLNPFIYGIRGEIKPFRLLTAPSKRSNWGLLQEAALGASWLYLPGAISTSLTNSHPLAPLASTTNSLEGFGLDFGVPFQLAGGLFTFSPYLNFATLTWRQATNTATFGPGASIGLSGKALLLTYRAEGFFHAKGFSEGFFDSQMSYAFQRADKISNLLANSNVDAAGFVARMGADLGPISFSAGYEASYDTATLKLIANKASAELVLPKGKIKGISARAFYERRDIFVENLSATNLIGSLFDNKTLAGAEANLTILGPLSLTAKYSLTFPTAATPVSTFNVYLNFDLTPPATNAGPALPGVPTPALPAAPSLPGG